MLFAAPALKNKTDPDLLLYSHKTKLIHRIEKVIHSVKNEQYTEI